MRRRRRPGAYGQLTSGCRSSGLTLHASCCVCGILSECLDEERELLRKQRLRMDREQRVLDNIADKLGRVMPIDWRSERQQLFGGGDALLTPSPKAGKQQQVGEGGKQQHRRSPGR